MTFEEAEREIARARIYPYKKLENNTYLFQINEDTFGVKLHKYFCRKNTSK